MRRIFHKLSTLREALERVLNEVSPLGVEEVSLENALGRVLASDIYAEIDLPPFDRSLVDGYAVKAEDTYLADENNPIELRLVGKIDVGEKPRIFIGEGECAEVSTGAPIPRGANAVVMIEHTSQSGNIVKIFRAVRPGENVAQTGSDISAGDLVLRRGRVLGTREVAALAALGCIRLKVYKRPRITVFSIGRELVRPGQPLELGKVYDVNSYSVLGMLAELGLSAEFGGILPDDEKEIVKKLEEALKENDVVITSGGTSAGLGDLTYRAFENLGRIIVHGIGVKPGKPTIITITHEGKLLIGLPGFPLSAMIIFIFLVKPILMRIMGTDVEEPEVIRAESAFRLNVGGRTYLIPVHLATAPSGLRAYPVLGDSGSTSALLDADGFIEIPGEKQYLDEGEMVEVKLFRRFKPASAVIIGSHCPALDLLLDTAGLNNVKLINAGSLGGWLALKKGEADMAGTHLLDEETMMYNVHMPKRLGLENEVEVYGGYIREIGFITAPGNPKSIKGFEDLLRPDIIFINRVTGSGIRTFTDLQLKKLGVTDPEKRIRGYTYQVRTHTAVAAAVSQGRADVGIAVGYVAKIYGLEFIHLADERFDFAVRRDRLYKESIKRILDALRSRDFAEKLSKLPHYRVAEETGRKLYPPESGESMG